MAHCRLPTIYSSLSSLLRVLSFLLNGVIGLTVDSIVSVGNIKTQQDLVA